MAISYVDFQRYSQLAKEMAELQQQLNDANLEGDTVRASFIEQKIVLQKRNVIAFGCSTSGGRCPPSPPPLKRLSVNRWGLEKIQKNVK